MARVPRLLRPAFLRCRARISVDILPPDTGLILADRYGGEIIREAPETRLPAARRKAVTLAFARAAAARLANAIEPPIPGQPGNLKRSRELLTSARVWPECAARFADAY